MRFGVSGADLSCWRLRLGGKSAMSLVRFRMKAIHSGRFVLSQIRCRNICKKLCQINRILAIAGLASKRAWLAVNLSTLAGLVAASFAAPVDVTGAVKRQALCRSGRSRRHRLSHLLARFRVLARTVDRFRKCHQGHALLSGFDWSRCTQHSRSTSRLR